MINQAISYLLPRVQGTYNQQRLSILIYHRVLAEPDYMRPHEPSVAEFDWQMALLRRYFFPLSLHQALQHLDQGTLPANAVCVTFDDGYADNATQALPILQKWQIPATVFVATGFLNGGMMWNDQVIETLRQQSGRLELAELGLAELPCDTPQARQQSALTILNHIKHWPKAERDQAVAQLVTHAAKPLPADLMLTDQMLVAMACQGVEIGGHTVSHPILTRLSDVQAWQEIGQGKTQLETILRQPVRFFAYPNGRPGQDYQPCHSAMVKQAGFSAALSTTWGVSAKNSDRYQLPRFTPWDRTPGKFLVRLLLNQRQLVL